MKRGSIVSISELFAMFLKENGLENEFLVHQIPAAWEKVVGKYATTHVYDLQMRRGVLFVRTHNAPFRQELFFQREKIRMRLNEHLGSEIIREMRILG